MLVVASSSRPSISPTYMTKMQLHAISPNTADYPHEIDEEFDMPEILQDDCEELYPFPSVEDDDGRSDILATLNRKIEFSRTSYLDHDTRYFGVDDSYVLQADDEYDYPRGIDDDEDSYTRDPDLRIIFEQGSSTGGVEKWDQVDFSHPDEEITNAQYFDAVEQGPRADRGVLFSSHYEDDEEDSDFSFEIEDPFGKHSSLDSLNNSFQRWKDLEFEFDQYDGHIFSTRSPESSYNLFQDKDYHLDHSSLDELQMDVHSSVESVWTRHSSSSN